MPSIWEQQSFLDTTDFCIVGAGLSGLFTALELRQKYPTASIRILERGAHPMGASVKNAGFACFGSPSEILDDAAKEGIDKAIARVIKRYNGLQRIRQLLGDEACGWQPNGGYEVFGLGDKDSQKECIEALPLLNQYISEEFGFEAYTRHSGYFGMKVAAPLIKIEGEASLNTGVMMKNLLLLAADKDIDLRFGSAVSAFTRVTGGVTLKTDQGLVYRSERLILATNAFTRNLCDLPVFPNRGQVLLTEPIPGLKLKGNFHLDQGYYYFRDYQGGILLGGGRHLDYTAEQTESVETTATIQAALDQLLSEIILPRQAYKLKLRWAGTMGFGAHNEKEPIIKEVEPGIYVGVRLGGMGVAMAPMLAKEIVALI